MHFLDDGRPEPENLFPAAMTRKALTDHLPVKLLKEANSFVVPEKRQL
jgi:hypothetical protein